MKRMSLSCVSVVVLLIMISCSTEEEMETNSIPYPKQEWKGVQGKSLIDSKPYFIGQPEAPEDAPNVMIIMLDDAGYSSATSYGGVMHTPTFDRIGDAGVRYTHMVKITLKHTMKEPKLNGPSTVEFFINDEKVGEMDITATVYGAYTGHETFDIGRDEGMPVNEEYADLGKFEFTEGQLHKVIFDIKNPDDQEVTASEFTDID